MDARIYGDWRAFQFPYFFHLEVMHNKDKIKMADICELITIDFYLI